MAVLNYVLEEPEQLVSVVAPSDMEEGYKFEVEFNGQPFVAETPPGGVVAGQAFLTPLGNYNGPNIKAPSGHWKDGPLDFFALGIFSPHLWCAWCCTQCAMGQVMQRLRLDWLGRQATENQSRNTLKVCVALVASYTLFSYSLDYLSPSYEYSDMAQPPLWLEFLRNIGLLLFISWSVYALSRTRAFVRAKYRISEERCPGYEDVCCSLFCACCTVAQISRHTGEHETYRSVCCSETGLPADAPMLV